MTLSGGKVCFECKNQRNVMRENTKTQQDKPRWLRPTMQKYQLVSKHIGLVKHCVLLFILANLNYCPVSCLYIHFWCSHILVGKMYLIGLITASSLVMNL